jgi:hypothetical protein
MRNVLFLSRRNILARTEGCDVPSAAAGRKGGVGFMGTSLCGTGDRRLSPPHRSIDLWPNIRAPSTTGRAASLAGRLSPCVVTLALEHDADKDATITALLHDAIEGGSDGACHWMACGRSSVTASPA